MDVKRKEEQYISRRIDRHTDRKTNYIEKHDEASPTSVVSILVL